MKKVFGIIGLVFVFVVGASAASFDIESYDAGPALIIKNTGTNNITIVIAGTSGSMTNTITYQSCATVLTKVSTPAATNLDELGRAIATVTNTAGVAISGVSYILGGVSTEAASGVLLAGTYTSTGGTDNCIIPWDTSAALHYTILGQTTYQPIMLDTIYGTIAGTGDGTLSVYVDGALAWQKLLAEPEGIYYDTTSGVQQVLSNVLDLPVDVGLPIGKGKTFFIRGARATTATTGNIGYSCTPRD